MITSNHFQPDLFDNTSEQSNSMSGVIVQQFEGPLKVLLIRDIAVGEETLPHILDNTGAWVLMDEEFVIGANHWIDGDRALLETPEV